MTSKEAAEILKNGLIKAPTERDWCAAFKMGIDSLEKDACCISGEWIPIKLKDGKAEEGCKLPQNNQAVLICTDWGVDITTFFCSDKYCGFVAYGSIDVYAWMPIPEPYKGDSEK